MALISSHMMRQRLDALLDQYTVQRRVAHIAAVKACMVQLDEVEAFAEEQEAALLHDRGQLATLEHAKLSTRVCLACGQTANDHLASCRTRQAGDDT